MMTRRSFGPTSTSIVVCLNYLTRRISMASKSCVLQEVSTIFIKHVCNQFLEPFAVGPLAFHAQTPAPTRAQIEASLEFARPVASSPCADVDRSLTRDHWPAPLNYWKGPLAPAQMLRSMHENTKKCTTIIAGCGPVHDRSRLD
eukprot:5212421-Amphidinium_carterae.1